MTVKAQQTGNPLSLFLGRLFPSENQSRSSDDMQTTKISMADLIALPRNSQLLLAYCLTRNYSEITLFNSDSDEAALADAGWLVSMPCPTLGILCYRFKPNAWRRLKELSQIFLKGQILVDVESYRLEKSALYPWNW